jgi:hypothetical protein
MRHVKKIMTDDVELTSGATHASSCKTTIRRYERQLTTLALMSPQPDSCQILHHLTIGISRHGKLLYSMRGITKPHGLICRTIVSRYCFKDSRGLTTGHALEELSCLGNATSSIHE